MPTKPTSSKTKTDTNVAQTVDALIEKALASGASDIHIEPRERSVSVRLRIDGWLREATKLPAAKWPAVLKDIKKRAGLKATNATTPQNGRATFESSHGSITLDIATMPVLDGEKAVIRLTEHLSEPASLEYLGFWGDGLREIEYTIAEPHGLVVASSPNKMAVAMNLIGMVHLLNDPALNIATLEAPITQRVPGVAQTEIPANASFGTYLKAALKQDPNVVMVSNLHDPDTLALSLQAALNGHLMLGGLHTTGAAQSVAHLAHMHAREPYMVAAGLRLSLGQRFVRKLCMHCRQAYLPEYEERVRLKQLLVNSGVRTVRAINELEVTAATAGIGKDAHGKILGLNSTEHRISRLYRAHPQGCQACRFTGYNGRVGLAEVLPITERIRQHIIDRADVAAIQQTAIGEGMVTLQLDGFIKALRGLTSMDEIFGVAGLRPRPVVTASTATRITVSLS